MNQIDDNVLGTLEFSSDRAQWEGQVELDLDHFADIIVRGAEERVINALARIRSFVLQLRVSDAEIRQAVANSLLDVYNTSWRVGPCLDAETLKQRLEIDLISFEADGNIEVWYQDTEEDTDSDLFGGHGIVVRIRPDGTIGKASVG